MGVMAFHHIQPPTAAVTGVRAALGFPKFTKPHSDRFHCHSLMMRTPVVTPNSRFRDYGVDVLCWEFSGQHRLFSQAPVSVGGADN